MQGSEQTPKAPLGNNARPLQPLHHRTVRTNIDFQNAKVRIVRFALFYIGTYFKKYSHDNCFFYFYFYLFTFIVLVYLNYIILVYMYSYVPIYSLTERNIVGYISNFVGQ